MLTLERASEFVNYARQFDLMTGENMAIEMFCEFEEQLNPFNPVSQEEQSRRFQTMFAEMSGFPIAYNVEPE